MNEWIVAWYGMIPTWLDERYFTFRSKTYCVCQTELSEQELMQRYACLNQQAKHLEIIPNLENRLLTQNWYLILEDSQPVTVNEILSVDAQPAFFGNQNLKNIREKWIENVEFVARRFLHELEVSHPYYASLYPLTLYYNGLAETAIAMLNDLIVDYGGMPILSSLACKRLCSLRRSTCFDLSNLTCDHRVRNVTELYKACLIDEKMVMEYTFETGLTVYEQRYLLARLFYPSHFYDVIEKYYFAAECDFCPIEDLLIRRKKYADFIRYLYAQLASSCQLPAFQE